MLETIGAVLTLYFVGKLIKANCELLAYRPKLSRDEAGAGGAPSKPKGGVAGLVLVLLVVWMLIFAFIL